MPLNIAERICRETFIAHVEWHAQLGSTNDRAKCLAGENPELLPVLIVADQQTAGRGRGSHRWWTGQGSLALSVLLPSAGRAGQNRHSPLTALATAVAIVETVAPLVPRHRVGIHWPNDVMADQRKIAGILTEVLPDGRQVVGVGINTNNRLADAPRELRGRVATLYELRGEEVESTDFLIALLKQLGSALTLCDAAPKELAARANTFCLQHGEILTLRLGTRSIEGRCGGIGPDGALLLDTGEGQEAFYSGTLAEY